MKSKLFKRLFWESGTYHAALHRQGSRRQGFRFSRLFFDCRDSVMCQVWGNGQGKEIETQGNRNLKFIHGLSIKYMIIISDSLVFPFCDTYFTVGTLKPFRPSTLSSEYVLYLDKWHCCFSKWHSNRTLKISLLLLLLLLTKRAKSSVEFATES